MSHLPPKPDFDYPARYPPDSRSYSRAPPPPTTYPPTPERYARDRHAYPPRSPPRTRAPPVSYIAARPVDPYRTRPPPTPVDTYDYDRREEDRHRERRHGEEYRTRPREEWVRERDRDRDRDRRGEDDTRRSYEGERKERQTSKERQWVRQREEERERQEREWARQKEQDRERQERDWARHRAEDRERHEREWDRMRDEDRRYGRDRTREVEPERKWIPRTSRSPPRRIGSNLPERPEPSPAVSRARTPSPSKHAAPPTPDPAASRPGSPYRVERSRPIRSQSPKGEVRLGNHSISVSRTSTRPRRELSPRDNDRRMPSNRRSRSPDRTRPQARRDPSRTSRAAPSDYRGRDRRSPPRRRSYSPASPPRRRSPLKAVRRRTPSPSSRSRSRSPTRTPPQKRHVLPPLKSPSRPPPPPPPTGPRIRVASLQKQQQQHPESDADGDIQMTEPSAEPEPVPAPASASPSLPDPTPAPVVASASPPLSIAAPVSPPPKATPVVPALPQKPDVEGDRRPPHTRRWSRSPPTAPRHHVPTPSNRSPAQSVPAGPSLPAKPEWGRRNIAHGGHQPTKIAETPVPAAVEPTGFQPVIPTYQAKPSVTADIEAEIARLRSHRMHIEHEYVEIAKTTKRALNDLLIADLELKNAEGRRAVTSAHLEKARIGMLGVDFISAA